MDDDIRAIADDYTCDRSVPFDRAFNGYAAKFDTRAVPVVRARTG